MINKSANAGIASTQPLEKIDKNIKNGWIAGIISGVITLGIMVLAMTTGTLDNLVDIGTTIDVVLVFALAFGIYKKSRFASTTMVLYFLVSKILFFAETGKATGWQMAIIFLYFYVQAMIATYQYHKLTR